MSILTGRLLPAEVLLATDTQARTEEGRARDGELLTHVTKCIALPHLKMIVGTRGHAAFSLFVMTAIQNTIVPGANFDGLAPMLAELVGAAYDAACLIVQDEHDMSDALEAMLFGWSDEQRRVLGFQLSNIVPDSGTAGRAATTGRTFTVAAMPDGFFLSPGLFPEQFAAVQARLKKKPPAADVIVEYAKAQRETHAALGNASSVGGRLILTTLNRNFINQRTIYEWPDFAATVESAA